MGNLCSGPPKEEQETSSSENAKNQVLVSFATVCLIFLTEFVSVHPSEHICWLVWLSGEYWAAGNPRATTWTRSGRCPASSKTWSKRLYAHGPQSQISLSIRIIFFSWLDNFLLTKWFSTESFGRMRPLCDHLVKCKANNLWWTAVKIVTFTSWIIVHKSWWTTVRIAESLSVSPNALQRSVQSDIVNKLTSSIFLHV